MLLDDVGVAIFAVGTGSFILQNYFQQQWADNFMMQLLADDLDTRRGAGHAASKASSSRWRISVATSGEKRCASVSTMKTERCWPPVQPIATVR